MSISNIRQRKLFNNPRHSRQNRVLTQCSNYEDDRDQLFNIKTEASEQRDSYSSRPTLQSSHLSRQLSVLETNINKQEAMTQKCFEQMQSLQNHYQILINKQAQKYEAKINQIRQRIQKQQARNKKIEQKNSTLISTILSSLLPQSQSQAQKNFPSQYSLFSKQNQYLLNPSVSNHNPSSNQCTHIKSSSTFSVPNHNNNPSRNFYQKGAQLLQIIKFQLSRRQVKDKWGERGEFCEERDGHGNGQTERGYGKQAVQQIGKVQDLQKNCVNYGDQTFVLDIRSNGEDRESESILLDDSVI